MRYVTLQINTCKISKTGASNWINILFHRNFKPSYLTDVISMSLIQTQFSQIQNSSDCHHFIVCFSVRFSMVRPVLYLNLYLNDFN